MIKMRFMDGKARNLNSLIKNQDAGFQIATGLWRHSDMAQPSDVQIKERRIELSLPKIVRSTLRKVRYQPED
jgi:hypothetical protein